MLVASGWMLVGDGPFHVVGVDSLRDDIPLLAKYFLSQYAEQFGKGLTLDRNVLRTLDTYHWPGNIRELENLMERVAALSEEGRITAEDLPDFVTRAPSEPDDFAVNLPPGGVALEKVEEYLIREALERNEWNQTRAAKFLKITRNTLIYRMQKYGLSAKAPSPGPPSIHSTT